MSNHHGRWPQWFRRDFSLIMVCLPLLLVSVPRACAQGHSPSPVPTSWQLGLRSTGYFYQNQYQDGSSDNRFQNYQAITGSLSGLADGHLVIRGSGRFTNDLAFNPAGFENSRLYSGHVEARLGPLFRARLGRQFIQSGVQGLTLDGAWLSYRRGALLDAALWGGARSPLGNGFDLGSLGDDAAAGWRVALRPSRKWRVAVSGAYRERYGMVAERPIGAEVKTSVLKGARLLGRMAYDLEQDIWAKVQLQAQWRLTKTAPLVGLQYLDRHPSIDAASWFARFTDLKRIKVARVSIRQVWPSRFGGELDYLGNFVDTRTSSRLGAAFIFPFGRFGYSLALGDAGEENRFFGEIGGQALPWLQADIQASVLTYALLENAPADDERELVTLTARLRATLRPGFRVMAQIQSLDNPFYSEDVRFLLGVDLSMARGVSRLGLDRGGWLQ